MLNMDYVLLSLEPSVHFTRISKVALPTHLIYYYTPHLTSTFIY